MGKVRPYKRTSEFTGEFRRARAEYGLMEDMLRLIERYEKETSETV